MINFPVVATWDEGKRTANAGTAIAILIPPFRTERTVLKRLEYTNGATAHTVTVMRPIGVTTVASAAAASQADVVLTADPGNFAATKRTADNLIAANDYCVFECPDGTFLMDTVSSVATLTLTMANNLPTLGFAAGAKVWFFGVLTDTNPIDARPHPLFAAPASVTTILDNETGIVSSYGKYEPLIVHDANATNAGTFDMLSAVYGGYQSPYFRQTSN